MRTLSRLAVVAAAALVTSAAFPSGASAQTLDESSEIVQQLRHDLTALGINTPVFLSQRLPGVMASSGIGAGSGLSDDSGGFKLGVLGRIALFNDFKSIGNGLQLIDIREEIPDLAPWPQLGVVIGVGLGHGLELGADVQFIPEMDVASDDLTAKTSLLSIAANLRWRATKPDGALPALVLGFGASYYFGSFELGAGYGGTYDETVEGQRLQGTYDFNVAPGVDWSLFQVNPEVQLAWDIAGVFRPYVGLGVGFTFGTVSDTATVRADLTLDSVNGQPTNERYTYEDKVVYYETEPALYTFRPHVGFDLVFGVVALTIQADLAIMSQEKLDTNVADAADSFDDLDDGDFLYAENRDGAQTNAALVLTAALKFQL